MVHAIISTPVIACCLARVCSDEGHGVWASERVVACTCGSLLASRSSLSLSGVCTDAPVAVSA